MKFSIIIPIYNTQDYLKQCVDSVLSQEYDDCEVIMVDDGSPDQSGLIADEYAKNNANIHVIHKENGGLSSARNAGLDKCRGDYVVFLDSDDYLAEDSLKTLGDIVDRFSPDIIAGYVARFTKDGLKGGAPFRKGLEEVVSGRCFYKIALYQDRLSVGAQDYIYRRSFLEKNHFRFKGGILHEDELWNPIVLYNAETIIDIKYRHYRYRCDNATSITRDPAKKQKRAKDRKRVAEELAAYFADKNESDANAFHDNISAQYMYAIYSGNMAGDKETSRSFPIKQARSMKYIIKSLLFFISPRLACRLRGLHAK